MYIQTGIQRQFQSTEGNSFRNRRKIGDENNLDPNEAQTLQLAFILGLGDKVTKEKYVSML